MNSSLKSHARPRPVDDALMFGCECALPFLTESNGIAAGRRAFSGLALGAAVALGACEYVPEPAPQPVPTDKVSAAFAKVDREIARTKARLKRADGSQQRMAEAEHSPPR